MRGGLRALAIGLMATTASAAFAQTAPAPADDAAAAEKDDVIVTGFKKSLESATNTKKKIDQIVESVTAEDIGKLPDASIAESIARLPGLTTQRLNGRANVISIRGFGPDLSTTLLNGREQTSTGDARAVEFDQYPSEVVSQVVVYKTPVASLIGQGLAGTVDIRTIRPLDVNKRVIAIGARGVNAELGALNAGSTNFGYRVNATYVDQFFNNTLGISLAASYLNEPDQFQEFNSWGYAGNGSAGAPFLIGGNRSFVRSNQLSRFGFVGTVQWRPRPELTMTLDGFYSDFRDNSIGRGIELPLGFGGGFNVLPATNTRVVNGVVTSGRFDNVRGVVRNDPAERNAQLTSLGYNIAWKGNDGWSASFDFGYSRTDRNELIFESYSGTGFNGDDARPGFPLGTSPAGSIGFELRPTGAFYSSTLNYSDPNVVRLTDPLGWGGGTVPQAGYFNNRIVQDDLKQYRLKVEHEFGSDFFIKSVEFGLGYIDRNKSLTPDESFIRLANGATSLAIPTQFLQRPTQLSYLGLGPVVSYDPRQLLNAGVLTLESRTTANDVLAKAYRISEKLMQAYIQGNLQGQLGAAQITGNFGLQIVTTNQRSSGLVFPGGQRQQISLGANYTDLLPSFNISARFPNDFVVRFAAAREIQRPRLDDLRVAIEYGYNTQTQLIQGSGGNPLLQPYRANAFDLNFEKYFGGKGFIAVQLFYKQLENYIFGGRLNNFNYGGFPTPPNTPVGTPTIGILNAPVNTRGGELYGVELSTTIPFEVITPALTGFGVTGGGGYSISRIRNDLGAIQAIPGYSKWTASGTLFWEQYGFSVRGSVRYRSDFLAEVSGFGANREVRTAVPETLVDAQVGYDFGRVGPLAGVSVFFQAQNLTNERFATIVQGNPLLVRDYQVYGRRYFLGAGFKF
ncbi:MAG: TonB-dependent receptor [Sphingomonas sp.]|uniref:TonB-dependent receptor n=1 Tax=Sphingomonas sp. TaxID=28214 RepID=UPI0025FD6311|nr:TonB-dependent receptor [Sphingomonas sp.]MBY0283093.1 TonB-dependent receptor [Sphingomonas sp.]